MRRTAVATALLVTALAGRALSQTPPDQGDSVPVGYGTLKQEDIALRLQTPQLLIRVMPLSEDIIRLLSPDSYASLHALRNSWMPAIDSAAQQNAVSRPTVFLVSFFGVQDRAPFTAEDVTVTSRNRLFRAEAILPLTPVWNTQQIPQRVTVSALYLFDDGIPLLEPFVVSYGGINNAQWESTITTLEQERAQVFARAAAGKH